MSGGRLDAPDDAGRARRRQAVFSLHTCVRHQRILRAVRGGEDMAPRSWRLRFRVLRPVNIGQVSGLQCCWKWLSSPPIVIVFITNKRREA